MFGGGVVLMVGVGFNRIKFRDKRIKQSGSKRNHRPMDRMKKVIELKL